MTDKALMQQALEALEAFLGDDLFPYDAAKVIDALRERLAQPEQEPVMIYHGRCTIDCGAHGHQDVELLKMIPAGSKLYTSPQPAQRKPLTDEEFISMLDSTGLVVDPELAFEIKALVEAAHGIKENT